MNTVNNRTTPGIPDLHAYLGEFEPFGLKPLAEAWAAAGVGWTVGVGDDLPTSEAAVEAAWSLRNTVAGVGLHPKRLPATGVGAAEQLEELRELSELATDPQVAVISDVGIDDSAPAPRHLQEDVFRALLDVAVATSRSVLVHWNAPIAELVESWDTQERPPRAAILGFEGDAAQARQLLERGFYFSISPDDVGIGGAATAFIEVLAGIPAERLFVHSNARGGDDGQGATPAIVTDVLALLAKARHAEVDSLASQINHNLWEFLQWRPK